MYVECIVWCSGRVSAIYIINSVCFANKFIAHSHTLVLRVSVCKTITVARDNDFAMICCVDGGIVATMYSDDNGNDGCSGGGGRLLTAVCVYIPEE